jgi:hypothetical protein
MRIGSDSRIHKFTEAVNLAVLDCQNMHEIGIIFFIRVFDSPFRIPQNNDFVIFCDKFRRVMNQTFLGFAKTGKITINEIYFKILCGVLVLEE